MNASNSSDTGPEETASSLLDQTPIGKLGWRGRRATAEERQQVFDAFFFEGGRRVPYLQQFYVLMLLSAAIAALGLANNSAAVVIGAMLVAPLMTPILAIAASLVQGWPRRMADSLAIVGSGALAAIAVGLVVGLLTPALRSGLPLPTEILARTNPNLIDLGIAIAAGAAGGFVAVRTDAGGALPGVGIAVALVPPLATVGMTAGLGEWSLAGGALLLFLTNLVAIVFSAGLVFTAAGFAAYRDEVGRRQARAAVVIIVGAIIIIGIPLMFHSQQRLEYANETVAIAREVEEWAPDVRLNDIAIDETSDPTIITVAVTGSEAPPDANTLATMIAETLGEAIHVDVVFVPVASGSAAAP